MSEVKPIRFSARASSEDDIGVRMTLWSRGNGQPWVIERSYPLGYLLSRADNLSPRRETVLDSFARAIAPRQLGVTVAGEQPSALEPSGSPAIDRIIARA